MDEEWEGRLNNSIAKGKSITYQSFFDFLDLKGEKVIIFFNIIDGYKLKKYKKRKDIYLIFRPRGIIPEESYYKKGSKNRKRILEHIEYKVLKKTDYFIFISENQKIHYLSKYQDLTNELNNNTIIPNLKPKIDYNLKSINNSEVKLVYSGGFSKWQNIELIFKTVSQIYKYSSLPIKFTILTFEENFKHAHTLAKKNHLSEIVNVKYIEPLLLDEELFNHDIGIIIRDNNIINLASSPFKIFDYITNGLSLIVSDSLEPNVRDILNNKQYFVVNYNKYSLNYNIEDLLDYISKFKNTDIKRSILGRYSDYYIESPKINFNDILI
ncbi:hypothetical protein ACGTN9_03210 [Halobacillus sp. MO56]